MTACFSVWKGGAGRSAVRRNGLRGDGSRGGHLLHADDSWCVHVQPAGHLQRCQLRSHGNRLADRLIRYTAMCHFNRAQFRCLSRLVYTRQGQLMVSRVLQGFHGWYTGSAVETIDSLRFLAECRKRRLKQVCLSSLLALSLWVCLLLFVIATCICTVSLRWYVFCLLVILVKVSIRATNWLERLL